MGAKIRMKSERKPQTIDLKDIFQITSTLTLFHLQ